ncbi:hypothetical protein A2865_02670 [Candidatus Woesebacteria bacterium RIFCSPHIGHO2_01_FULL_39_17]|nr:MAG: hypothetical protein A2865_02670 [Candidatus Woesebacteria bacterium RIFCSPHIGHO2_01_FULL_39_17]
MSYGLERFIYTPEYFQTTPEKYFQKVKAFSDNDGVRSDTRTLVIKVFNGMFGTNYIASDIREWRSIEKLAKIQGLSDEDAQVLEKKLWYDPDLLYKADPVPGATEMSFWFYDHGYSFPVISSRTDLVEDSENRLYKNVYDATIAWFKRWEPWMPSEHIYIQSPHDIKREIYKAFMYGFLTRDRHGEGVFFEDVPSHAKTILTYNPKATLVLLSDLCEMDYLPVSRLNYIRISGSNGNLPNMQQAYDLFINRKSSVAQC